MTKNKFIKGSVEQQQYQQLEDLQLVLDFKAFINWNKLCTIIDGDSYKYKGDIVIAGGTLTSFFSKRPLNDIDIFFEHEDDLLCFKNRFSLQFNEYNPKGASADMLNAYSYNIGVFKDEKKNIHNPKQVLVQLIHKTRPIEDTLESFDFTVCKAAFSLMSENFYLHPTFLTDLLQNKLILDGKYSPVTALFRVLKYQKKGFEISNLEMAKLILAINSLNLKTNQDALTHFRGVYITKPVYGLIEGLSKDKEALFNLNSLQTIEAQEMKKRYKPLPNKDTQSSKEIEKEEEKKGLSSWLTFGKSKS